MASGAAAYSAEIKDFALFIPPNLADNGSHWAASVLATCGNYGTYAIQCTSHTGVAPSTITCGPQAPTLTVTEALLEFKYTTSTSSSGTHAEISESCTLNGAANATCVASYKYSSHGTKTHSAVTTTLDSNALNSAILPVNVTSNAAALTASAGTDGVCKSAAVHSLSFGGLKLQAFCAMLLMGSLLVA